jgi:hypothetical protein
MKRKNFLRNVDRYIQNHKASRPTRTVSVLVAVERNTGTNVPQELAASIFKVKISQVAQHLFA